MAKRSKLSKIVGGVLREPPFRLATREWVRMLPFGADTKSRWDAVRRPHYLFGVLSGAEAAVASEVKEISVFEFGVAEGAGLLAMQTSAERVEALYPELRIRVYGFDTGAGLPAFGGDYRDHPDAWKPGDYAMDEARLRGQLASRTELVLGDVRETVPEFLTAGDYPRVAFVSIDLDLYEPTLAALSLVGDADRRSLPRVALYFDDVAFHISHRFAGELLAIEEFNRKTSDVKIDRWRGIENKRPFPESPWLRQMYIAHDLRAISAGR